MAKWQQYYFLKVTTDWLFARSMAASSLQQNEGQQWKQGTKQQHCNSCLNDNDSNCNN